jgi:hypothetical protein
MSVVEWISGNEWAIIGAIWRKAENPQIPELLK